MAEAPTHKEALLKALALAREQHPDFVIDRGEYRQVKDTDTEFVDGTTRVIRGR